MSLGRSGPGVRSGFLEIPRTRFGGVFLASAQTASQVAVSRHARVASGAAAFRAVTVTPVPACHGIALLANVPDRGAVTAAGG